MSNFLQVLCRFFRGFSPKSDNVLPFSYRLYGWLSEIISEILVGFCRFLSVQKPAPLLPTSHNKKARKKADKKSLKNRQSLLKT